MSFPAGIKHETRRSGRRLSRGREVQTADPGGFHGGLAAFGVVTRFEHSKEDDNGL